MHLSAIIYWHIWRRPTSDLVWQTGFIIVICSTYLQISVWSQIPSVSIHYPTLITKCPMFVCYSYPLKNSQTEKGCGPMKKGQGENKLWITGGGQEIVLMVRRSVAKNLITTVQVNWCSLIPAPLEIGTNLPESLFYFNFFLFIYYHSHLLAAFCIAFCRPFCIGLCPIFTAWLFLSRYYCKLIWFCYGEKNQGEINSCIWIKY